MAELLKKVLEEKSSANLAFDRRDALDTVPDFINEHDIGHRPLHNQLFSFEEFFARHRKVSRRVSAPRLTLLQVRDVVLNEAAREVTLAGELISLRPLERRKKPS